MKGLTSHAKNFRFYPDSQHLPNILQMTALQDVTGDITIRGGMAGRGQSDWGNTGLEWLESAGFPVGSSS